MFWPGESSLMTVWKCRWCRAVLNTPNKIYYLLKLDLQLNQLRVCHLKFTNKASITDVCSSMTVWKCKWCWAVMSTPKRSTIHLLKLDLQLNQFIVCHLKFTNKASCTDVCSLMTVWKCRWCRAVWARILWSTQLLQLNKFRLCHQPYFLN